MSQTSARDNRIVVVDATIRDGGYANNYGFTAEQVKDVVLRLEGAGVRFIEIGHGYGLGAERTMGKMAETELRYIEAVRGQTKTAKVGMFANANITSIDDVKRAADLGLGFVRVGCIGFDGPHPLAAAAELVREARSRGMWASLNLVRTQNLTWRELERAAAMADAADVSAIYVVDSTGGAFPRQVAEAVRVLKAATATAVGFHGHQNLDLGVANSLAAIDAGATMVDGTLGGIGRESGNVQLEVLVACLDKLGFDTGLSFERLAAINDELITPIMGRPLGIRGENLLLGRHDLFAHGIALCRQVAEKRGLDPRAFVAFVGRAKPNFEDLQTIEALADEAAKALTPRR